MPLQRGILLLALKGGANGTVIISSACQINCHTLVSVNSIMAVIEVPDPCHNLRFLGIIIRLPVFPVVVIDIRIYFQPA